MPFPTDYRGLLGCDMRPATLDEKKFLLLLATSEMLGTKTPPQLSEIFTYRVASRRCAAQGIKAPSTVLSAIAALSSTPAVVVLWCYTLLLIELEGRKLTIPEVFPTTPDGKCMVPTDEAYKAIWEAQKITKSEERTIGRTDNWLDVTIWRDVLAIPDQAE